MKTVDGISKRLLALTLAIIMMMAPIGAMAADKPSEELTQGGKIIAFVPEVTSYTEQKSSMVVNIDTVSCAFMFEIQWADTPDFKRPHTQFYRNVDNHGCMIVDIEKQGSQYVREIWYGGYKMSYRRSQTPLTTPQSVVNQLRQRLAIKKRLYVPGKGRYVRVRCLYYGTFFYAYSRWVKVR